MTVHIIPSGGDKTFCGLRKDVVKYYSSLGFGCDCDDCIIMSEKIMKLVRK